MSEEAMCLSNNYLNNSQKGVHCGKETMPWLVHILAIPLTHRRIILDWAIAYIASYNHVCHVHKIILLITKFNFLKKRAWSLKFGPSKIWHLFKVPHVCQFNSPQSKTSYRWNGEMTSQSDFRVFCLALKLYYCCMWAYQAKKFYPVLNSQGAPKNSILKHYRHPHSD